ncbi:MAG: diguanylate cyclase domain-containing protein [Solirubrobacteraceae bacterium]
MNSEPVRVAGENIALSASIGAAWSGNAPAEIDTLLRAADRGLYAAKRAGRNRGRLASGCIQAGEEPEPDSPTLRHGSQPHGRQPGRDRQPVSARFDGSDLTAEARPPEPPRAAKEG